MDEIEIKEYLLTNGKFKYRAVLNGNVIMVASSRTELVRALRKKLGV